MDKEKKNKLQTNPEEEDKETFLQTELMNIWKMWRSAGNEERDKRCRKAPVNEERRKRMAVLVKAE